MSTCDDKQCSFGQTAKNDVNLVKVKISSERKFFVKEYPPGDPNDFFEKSKIEEQVLARLNQKKSMTSNYKYDDLYPQQGDSSLCGPAAFMYALLVDRPDLYKQYIKNLWDNGEAHLGKLYIKPSESARHPKNYSSYINSKVRPRVPPIDWISLASLRDSENNILMKYDSPDDKAAGVTMWPILSEWFKKLGADNVFSNIDITGSSYQDIIDLSSYVSPSYHVLTLIGSKLLSEYGNTRKDHWIVWTTKPIVITTKLPVTINTDPNELVELGYFSWGKVDKITVTLRNIKRYLYGGRVFTRIP